MKRLLQHPIVQAVCAKLLGLYLAFALRTTRWSLDGREHMAPHAAGAPVIVAFWHERLPMMPMLWLKARRSPEGRRARNRAHVLVSQHRDGRFIGAVVSRFALNVVMGSSTRGGAKSLRLLLNLLAGGDHIAITPDGPRGPRRVAAAGVAQLAALSGAPILPCAAQTTRHRVLRTWDRMVVPRPFGRGVVVCLPPIAVGREDWQQALPEVGAALTMAAERADRLCLA
ncbi:MAG TPA: DUF374 domain-containing protein [Acetobacteraceae bacterium]|jgi:hypothetical protein|nr:DUF374 domain-containing protein [Acetobacteraceae bacterium]